GLVDELIGFTAGVTLGAEGWPALGAMGVEALAEAPRFRLVEARPMGGDVLHRWVRG
ncbi:riboflavin biosynthesis protein RibD, partial [Thioclava sp. BHET1]